MQMSGYNAYSLTLTGIIAPRRGSNSFRQAADPSLDQSASTSPSVAAADEKCVEKVMMVEETEYDEQVLASCSRPVGRKFHTCVNKQGSDLIELQRK